MHQGRDARKVLPGEMEEEEEEGEEGGAEHEEQPAPGEELPEGGGVRGDPDIPNTTELTFSRTLRSGETVKHDQTYTIEVGEWL